ncbi:S-layer homology domain-containing protein [Caldicellulosiruptor saccharolyticus]|uniref:S-layer homology domain-containing protein n=1 Tax=Caldicellulosiruptor saccharolyticus TaxID=44001 RepID=UPI0038B9E414
MDKLRRKNPFLSLLIILVFALSLFTPAWAQQAIEYTTVADYSKMIKNTEILQLPQNPVSKKGLLFLAALGFLNSTNKENIKPSDILTKEEALSIILNSAGKQQDAFLRAEKLESKRVSGTKLVVPYNYLYLGYIQLAYDLKVISKKEYQDAMSQVRPSQKDHEKMTDDLIKKNNEIVSRAIYEGRPYSYDDLIFVRSAPATRQEVARWVVLTFKIPQSYENLAKTYPDYDKIDSKFLSSINTLLKNGSLIGRTDGYLHPDDYITYEELSFILYNLKDYIVKANNLKEMSAELKNIQRYSDKTVYNFEDDNGNDIEITTIPGKQDFVVLTDSGAGLSSSLQQGDYIDLYVNDKGQVVLGEVLSKAGTVTLKGVITKIDVKKNTIQIKMPDGKAYDLLVNPKAIIYDTRASKAINLSDLSVGNIAVVVAKKNRADNIEVLSYQDQDISRIEGVISQISNDRIVINSNGKLMSFLLSPDTAYIDKGDFTRGLTKNDFYQGMKVLVGEYGGFAQYISTTYDERAEDIVGGILYEIDTNLSYIEIYNQDGVRKSYRFSKKMGLKVIKDGKTTSPDSLSKGDIVYLYFNGDFVRSITASSNLQPKIAKIENIQRNPITKMPEKIYLNINGKVYGPYELSSDVEVVKSNSKGSLKDLVQGQYVKVTGSFFGASANIKKIEISTNDYVKNIYIAKATTIGNILYLSDISILRNNQFERLYDYKTFKIPSDALFIVDGIKQKSTPILQNFSVVVITKDRFSQETVATVFALSKGWFSQLQGEVTNVKSGTITLSGEQLNFNQNSYIVENGLLSNTAPKVGDEIIAVSDGKNLVVAKYKEAVSKPIIVRGEVSEISELEYIKLKNFVYLDKQNGWQFVSTPLVLSYDTQTVYCDVYGINNPKDILGLINKSVYVIHDGKYAKSIIDASFGGYIVIGTIGKNGQVLNPQYHDMVTKTWNKINTSLVLDPANAILINSSGDITSQPPQYGDEVILLVPQTSFNISKGVVEPSIVIINY